jgi:hypothetical protein
MADLWCLEYSVTDVAIDHEVYSNEHLLLIELSFVIDFGWQIVSKQDNSIEYHERNM